MDYSKKWLHAASVFRGQSEPFPPGQTENAPSLFNWGQSREGEAALYFLAEIDKEIVIGRSEEGLSHIHEVVLMPQGICSRNRLVGIVANYSGKKLATEAISESQAVHYATNYNEEINCWDDLVSFLRKKLSEIAEEINEKALEK